MTTEQIKTIHDVREEREHFIQKQREALAEWEKENLDSLLKQCDHTYPWNSSAVSYDSSCSYSYCRICSRNPLIR